MCSALCASICHLHKNAGSIGGSTKSTRQSSMLTRLCTIGLRFLLAYNFNGKKCTDLDVKLKNGDKIVHRTHRHEPPVLGGPIEAHVDENYVIVSKPSTIPVHPCGAYYHNTLIHILRKERPELWPLNVVHRIDRLTSGLVLLAAQAKQPENFYGNRKEDCHKCYLARVAGISKDVRRGTFGIFRA